MKLYPPPAPLGKDFGDPREFSAYAATATNINVYDSGGTIRASSTTNFFTELARRGLQEQTDYAAGVYKTLLSVPSGMGSVAHIICCTAGGAETTTIRITADGFQYPPIPVVLASGQRAWLSTGTLTNSNFVVNTVAVSGTEALAAGKSTFSESFGSTQVIPPWFTYDMFGRCLKFRSSLLIEAKHSVSITNATATAYSAVMYKLGAGS